MIKYILAAVSIVSVIALGFTITFDPEEPEWEKEVIADQAIGFVDVEAANNVHGVARTEQGLLYIHKERKLMPWEKEDIVESEFISRGRSVGAYAAIEVINGSPSVVFQDADTGRERVVFANRSRSGNWTLETIDNVSNRGINVGMYADISKFREKPVLFYHSDFNEPFIMARPAKTQWNSQVVDTGAGFFTDAESCGDRVKVAYRNRSTTDVFLGTFDGAWNTKEIGVNSISLDMELEDCEPRMLYKDPERAIKYWNNSDKQIASARKSRVSLDFDGEAVSSYSNLDQNRLNYGILSEEWNFSTLDVGENTGEYNDISSKGRDRYALYTNDSEIVYAEFEAERIENEKKFVKTIRIVSFALLCVAGLLAGWMFK